MDLVVGARRVIVAMEHTSKGSHKILNHCRLPITAARCVNTIITEMGVMEVTPQGLELRELGEGYTVEMVQQATECPLIVNLS